MSGNTGGGGFGGLNPNANPFVPTRGGHSSGRRGKGPSARGGFTSMRGGYVSGRGVRGGHRGGRGGGGHGNRGGKNVAPTGRNPHSKYTKNTLKKKKGAAKNPFQAQAKGAKNPFQTQTNTQKNPFQTQTNMKKNPFQTHANTSKNPFQTRTNTSKNPFQTRPKKGKTNPARKSTWKKSKALLSENDEVSDNDDDFSGEEEEEEGEEDEEEGEEDEEGEEEDEEEEGEEEDEEGEEEVGEEEESVEGEEEEIDEYEEEGDEGEEPSNNSESARDDDDDDDDDVMEEEDSSSTVDRTGIPSWVADRDIRVYRAAIMKMPGYSGKLKTTPHVGGKQMLSSPKREKAVAKIPSASTHANTGGISSSNSQKMHARATPTPRAPPPIQRFDPMPPTKIIKGDNRGADDENTAVVGTCTEMCPLEEQSKRISQEDVQTLEQEHPSRPGWTHGMMMVKQHVKSSQDTQINLPHLIRTPATLWNTWKYMVTHILDIDAEGQDRRFMESRHTKNQDRASNVNINMFIWDRSKMIRKDWTMQGYQFGHSHPLCTRFFEEVIAYHIWIEYEVGDKIALNRPALNNCLKQLCEYYDADLKNNIKNDREAEMRSYYIINQIANNAKEVVPTLIKDISHRPEIMKSRFIQDAIALWTAYKTDDYRGYIFVTRKSPSVLFSCQAYIHLRSIRYWLFRQILNAQPKKANSYPVADIVDVFGFDNVDQAVLVCEWYGLQITNVSGSFQIDTRTKPVLPEMLKCFRSELLVETKRGPPDQRSRRAIVEAPSPKLYQETNATSSVYIASEITYDSPGTNADIAKDRENTDRLADIKKEKELHIQEAKELREKIKLRQEQKRLEEKRRQEQIRLNKEHELIREEERKVVEAQQHRLHQVQTIKSSESQAEEERRRLQPAQEKASEQTAAQKAAAQQKAAQEKAAQEKAIREKLALEQAARQKAARERALAAERHAAEKKRVLAKEAATAIARSRTAAQTLDSLRRENLILLRHCEEVNDLVEMEKLIGKARINCAALSASLKTYEKGVTEMEKYMHGLHEYSLLALLEDAKSASSNLRSSIQNAQSKEKRQKDAILGLSELLERKKREQLECNLAIKYFRFCKWKVLVKTKYGPMVSDIRHRRFLAALSAPLSVPNGTFQLSSKRRKSLIFDQSMSEDEMRSFLTSPFELWQLFSSTSAFKLVEEDDRLWKLSILVDAFPPDCPFLGFACMAQRWILSKFSQGAIAESQEIDSSISRIISAYRVPLATNKNESLDFESEDDFDKNQGTYLRVCVRSVSATDSGPSRSKLLRGSHAIVFPVYLSDPSSSKHLSRHDLHRFANLTESLSENAYVPLLVPVVCLGECWKQDRADRVLDSVINELKTLDQGKIKSWKACFLMKRVTDVKHIWKAPPREILPFLSSEELKNGVRWSAENRSRRIPLVCTTLASVLQEWYSYVPVVADEISPQGVINHFNIVLATTLHLLTDRSYQKLPSNTAAPEFQDSDDGEGAEILFDWNSDSAFDHLESVIQASFLPPLPDLGNSESETSTDFEEYRNNLDQYVIALGHGPALVIPIHNLMAKARSARVSVSHEASVPQIKIPWNAITDLIIDCQIERLVNSVVYPSEVGEFQNVCSILRTVRDAMPLPQSCVPLYCTDGGDTHIQDALQVVKFTNQKKRSRDYENEPPMFGPLTTSDSPEANFLLKKRRIENGIDQAFEDEKLKSMDFEEELRRMYKAGECFL